MTPDLFSKVPALRDMAVVCSLNNKSSLVYEDQKFNKQGEPTEAALRVFSEKLGQYDLKFQKPADYTKSPVAYGESLACQYREIVTLDFTSERKTMSTLVKGLVQKTNSLLLKGAPERVIEKCDTFMKMDGSKEAFSMDTKKNLVSEIQGFAK